MRCRRIVVLTPVSAVLALCTTLPTSLSAQYERNHPFALYTGLAFERGSSEFGRGLLIGGHLTLPANAWLGFRLDVGYTYFPGDYAIIDGNSSTKRNSLKALSLTANATFLEPLTAKRRITWSAGAGLYGVKNAFEGTSHTRLGWNARMSPALGRSLSLDFGYHGLIGDEPTAGFFQLSLALRP